MSFIQQLNVIKSIKQEPREKIKCYVERLYALTDAINISREDSFVLDCFRNGLCCQRLSEISVARSWSIEATLDFARGPPSSAPGYYIDRFGFPPPFTRSQGTQTTKSVFIQSPVKITYRDASTETTPKTSATIITQTEMNKRCVHCGMILHKTLSCPALQSPEKKCFICRRYGHFESACPRSPSSAELARALAALVRRPRRQ